MAADPTDVCFPDKYSHARFIVCIITQENHQWYMKAVFRKTIEYDILPVMPIIARASKKLRHDRKRTKVIADVKLILRNTIKSFRKSPAKKQLSVVFRTIDKAAKRNIIHKNKAARLKSRLAKLLK
jgi:small subunit ribosomal protein S20